VKVELLVAITLMASVTICILNSVCTVSYIPVWVSLLLQKHTTYRKLQSHIMVRNYITISLLAGNEIIKQFTTKHILHRHTHTHMHKHMRARARARAHTHTQTCAHAHTHMQSCTQIHMHKGTINTPRKSHTSANFTSNIF
jgi:ABC-type nickel/cobalt efflux system permease component RcnA